MRQNLVGAVLLHRQWATMLTPCLKFKRLRCWNDLRAHLFRLTMPQQSRGRGFWDHGPSRLQLYYVAEQQSQVDLIYIPPTACTRSTQALFPRTNSTLLPYLRSSLCFARKFVEGAQLEMVDAARSFSTQPHSCQTRTGRPGRIRPHRRRSALDLSTRVQTACRPRHVSFAAPSIAGIWLSSLSLQRMSSCAPASGDGAKRSSFLVMSVREWCSS